MLFTTQRVAQERVSRWTVWVFVMLLGAAAVASIGLPGGAQSPEMTLTGPGVVETSLSDGVTMLAGLVESAWRETVREVSRVVIAVLQWQWWLLETAIQSNSARWQDLSGGENVLHS